MGNVNVIEKPAYYRRLASYFPKHEMKDARHLQALVDDVPCYEVMETPEYLVLYADFEEFRFIDYLLVNGSQRGAGIGSRLMHRLQSTKTPILLEVEPADPKNPDTLKRHRFYAKNGFRVAEGVQYERRDEHGNPFLMDILYWSPSQKISDERVISMMTQVCSRIHNYNAHQFYDLVPADPSKVLSLAE